MIFTTTALGREVPEFDRTSQDEDRVLKILFDFRVNPFNPQNEYLDRASLARYARVEMAALQVAIANLWKRQLIEMRGHGAAETFRITTDGLIFVKNLPQAA